MISRHWPCVVGPLHPVSAELSETYSKPLLPLFLSPNNTLCCSIFNSKFNSEASFKCCCIKNDVARKTIKGFSALASDIPRDTEAIWSTMAFYMFNLHIPLGYGGLSIAAYVLNQPVLDPETQALSLLLFQILELSGALFLLARTTKPQKDLINFFKANKLPKERNWLLASTIGFGFLVLVVFSTSLIADRLFGAKAASNSLMREILLSSNKSKTALVLVNCIIAPLLEEAVYRGFLLTSLASKLNWQQAVVISSAIFSAAHFSMDNFVQLFIIGYVLGCSYCWSGNLGSSIVIHSLYNALILLMTLLS